MRTLFVAVLALVSAVGCAGLTNPFADTADYQATLCVTGAVALDCQTVGPIPIPKAGTSLLNLAVLVGGSELAKRTELKGCVLQSYPPASTGSTIELTATASCLLRGVRVDEQLTLTLTPATS